MPVFTRVIAYPPMRASTLATLELVTTLPETVSPGWTVVSLIAMSRICGAALGGRRRTLAVSLGGVTVGDGGGVEAGGGLAVGAGVAVACPAFTPPARCEAAGRGGTLGAGDGWAAPEWAAWLHPPNQSKAAPIARAERALGMHASSWTLCAFRSG